jgi:hypothetical protein
MRQTAQFGLETQYGTPVAVTKRFTSFGLGKERNMGVASSTPRGQTAATQGWVNTEDSAFSIEDGVLSYDEVSYLLNSAVNRPVPTTPALGTPTGSFQRVYSINQFVASSFQSYTIEQGDVQRQRGGRASGCTVQEWGFSVSSTDDSVGMSGNLIGWQLLDANDLVDDLASSDFVVVIPKHFKLYYADNFADLDVALNREEITNAFTAEFGIGDRRNLVRYLGKPSGSPSDTVETVPSLTFDLELADDADPVDTFLANARAGDKQFFRLVAEHPSAEVETDVPYKFQLDVCTVLRDGPSDDDSDGVQIVNFPYQPAYDPDSDKIFEITTVTGINNTALPGEA